MTLGLGVYCFGFKDQGRVRVAMMTMMMMITTLNDDDDDDDDAGRLTLSSATGSNGCVQALGGEPQEVPRTA